MENEQLIPAEECCTNYNIEYSFISSLQQYGLLEITTIKETRFLTINELQKLEKMIRLHYELEINLEGIEAITHLLDKVEYMQTEMTSLQNRLRLYEGENY